MRCLQSRQHPGKQGPWASTFSPSPSIIIPIHEGDKGTTHYSENGLIYHLLHLLFPLDNSKLTINIITEPPERPFKNPMAKVAASVLHSGSHWASMTNTWAELVTGFTPSPYSQPLLTSDLTHYFLCLLWHHVASKHKITELLVKEISLDNLT